MTKRKQRGKVDPTAFAETEREPVTRRDFEAVVRQAMAHSAKPEKRSENREPTREELSRKFKISRR